MRKFNLATAAYTVSVLLMHYVLPREAYSLLLGIIVLCGVLFGCLTRGMLRTKLLIICCFLALGTLRYENHVANKLDVVTPYIGNEHRVSAVVTDYPTQYDDCIKIPVRITAEGFPKVKAVVYDYNDDAPQLRPGDEIRAAVKFSSVTESYGEETDTYISKDIYLRGYIADHVTVVSRNENILRYAPKALGKWVRDTLATRVSGRTFAFLSALVTGDKTALYEDIEMNYALTRSGLSHVVAVSGMHVSFVLAFVLILFGNRVGWSVAILAMVMFALMTGMSPSVMRALFMQSLFLLAPVLRRESDGLTAISVPLLVLLFMNPFAVSSVSLQLSFAAMLGMILFTPKLMAWFEEKSSMLDGLLYKGYYFIAASLSASIAAGIFTLPLCAYHFGSINIISPISNLLILWMIPYCFVGALLLCVVSLFVPVATEALEWLLDMGVSFVYHCADLIGSFPYAAIYLPVKVTIAWFIVVYGLFFLVLSMKNRKPHHIAIPVAVTIVSILVLCGYARYEGAQGVTVTAVDVGQGQCIIVTDDAHTIMVDCGGDYDAGDEAAKWLYMNGRTQVDALVISHFDRDHVNGIVDLMAQIPVKQVYYCSLNLEGDAYTLLQEIMYGSQFGNTNLNIVNRPTRYHLGDMDVTLTVSTGDDSNDGIMVLIDSDGAQTLIMGDADFAAEEDLMASVPITDGDCLVVGHHGSKYSTGDELLGRFKPEYAIISCGYNSYGHPKKEVLDRLEEKNVLIYRTDQMGTIEVKVR